MMTTGSTRIELISQGFGGAAQGDARIVVLWVFIVLGVASTILALWLAQRLKRDRQRHGAVTRAMGRELGLSRSEMRVLERASARAGVAHAACCLVSDGCLSHVMKRAPAHGPERACLRDLQRRLRS